MTYMVVHCNNCSMQDVINDKIGEGWSLDSWHPDPSYEGQLILLFKKKEVSDGQ